MLENLSPSLEVIIIKFWVPIPAATIVPLDKALNPKLL